MAAAVKVKTALVNIITLARKGEFARIVLDEVCAIRNSESQMIFVFQSGYEIIAFNDKASIAAEEAWCRMHGIV